jgi:Flp pilus assembly pilin Flp
VIKIYKKNIAQSALEIALLIAIIAAVFIAMKAYVNRAVQANFKIIEDRINDEPQ